MSEMKIAAMTFWLYAPWLSSLKEKRSIVQRLKKRLQNTFAVSAAEIAQQDSHSDLVIGVAAIVPGRASADRLMEKITHFIESNTEAEIVEETLEIR